METTTDQNKAQDAVINAGKSAIEQYEKLTKGLNNPKIVNAMFTGKEAYMKELSALRKTSIAFWAAGLVVETMFTIFSNDPYLEAINELSNKIDSLRDKLTQSVEYLEKIIKQETYIKDAIKYIDDCAILKERMDLIYFEDGAVNTIKTAQFISNHNIEQLETLSGKIHLLFTRRTRNITMIEEPTFGNLQIINDECNRLLSTFIEVNNMLGLAMREKQRIEPTDIEEFNKAVTQRKKIYDKHFNAILEVIADMHCRVLSETKKYIESYLEFNELIYKARFDEASPKIICDHLSKQFTLHNFFITIYNGVGGEHEHSIGPGHFEDEIIQLRTPLGKNECNIVIYWLPKAESAGMYDKHEFDKRKKSDIDDINYTKYEKGNFDLNLQKALNRQSNYSCKNSRAIGLYNCTKSSGTPPAKFPKNKVPKNPPKLFLGDSNRIIYYAASDGLEIEELTLYKSPKKRYVSYEPLIALYTTVKPEMP
ncbi:hypothetical protein ACJD0Z_11380 [Flavobacteriaceae bacterium M23B6Z8]